MQLPQTMSQNTYTETATEYIHFSLPAVSTTTDTNNAASSAVTKHKHSTQSLNWQHLFFSSPDSKTTETDQCRFLRLCLKTQTLTVTDCIYALLFCQPSPRPKQNNAASSADYAPKHKHWHSHYTRLSPVSLTTETNNAASSADYAPKHKYWHCHCLYTLVSSQSPWRPKQTLAMQLPPLSQNINTQYSHWTDNTFFFLSQTPKRPKQTNATSSNYVPEHKHWL